VAARTHAREAETDDATVHIDELDPAGVRVEDRTQAFHALEDVGCHR
jgi:hypothetical protein